MRVSQYHLAIFTSFAVQRTWLMRMKGDGAWCQCQMSNCQKGFYDWWWGAAFSLTPLRRAGCTYGDYICGCMHVEGAARCKQRWAALGVWFCIRAFDYSDERLPPGINSASLHVEDSVKKNPSMCELGPSTLWWRAELCLNDRKGAKTVGLIYHTFTEAKADKQGLSKVMGWISCSR